jgi:hypothetical protein
MRRMLPTFLCSCCTAGEPASWRPAVQRSGLRRETANRRTQKDTNASTPRLSASGVAARDRLWEACAEIGRDPGEITTSIHLLADGENPGKAAEQAAAFAEAGVELGIVYLPPPHTPAVLEAHAEVLAPLAG